MAHGNRDTAAALAYHGASKYTLVRDASGGERFIIGVPADPVSAGYEPDDTLLPLPYKIYETLPPLALPRELAPSALPALEALARTGAEPQGEAVPDRAALARIALLSNGLLGRSRTTPGGRTIEYRTAGSTGALYHLELYFVCAELPDLTAGVYQYAAHDHSLRQLRAGDFRRALVDATGGEPAAAHAPVLLAITSTFWRNAWNYAVRAYRHAYWDAGTVLSHVFAVAAAASLPAELILGYADDAVNALLGVDGTREATVALCALGRSGGSAGATPPAPSLDYPTRPLSAREVTFPAIVAMHRASALTSGAEAAAWRAAPPRRRPPDPQGALIALEPLAADERPAAPIEEVILRRRSTRHYDVQTPVTFPAFSTVLECASAGCAADCLVPEAPPLHDLYLIVQNVAGLAPGIYRHHARRHAVELLRAGDFRQQARRIASEQDYAADAHVNCYALTGLGPVLERYGNRGYRLAQLESALYAGKLQLAAHALGLGAVGSTSLDDEVIDFFAPQATGTSYMFVTVFGTRRPKAS